MEINKENYIFDKKDQQLYSQASGWGPDPRPWTQVERNMKAISASIFFGLVLGLTCWGSTRAQAAGQEGIDRGQEAQFLVAKLNTIALIQGEIAGGDRRVQEVLGAIISEISAMEPKPTSDDLNIALAELDPPLSDEIIARLRAALGHR